jgi:hypothetical protein
VTTRSLEECPSGNPDGDGLGDAIEKDLGVEAPVEDSLTLRELEEDVKGLFVQSWIEEASELASHRPQTGQASSPSSEAELSSSLVLQNSQNVSPAILDCSFFDLGRLPDGVRERGPATAGEMVP